MSTLTASRLVLSGLLFLTIGFASRADAADYAKSYSVTGHPTVRVNTDDGTVRIVSSNTHQVEFRVHSEGSNFGVGFGGLHIDSHQNGDTVELEARSGHWGIGVKTVRMSIEVRMPEDADLQLETSDGSIDMSSLKGKITAHTSDGSISASRLSGTINLSSSDGSIQVEELKGDIRLRTSNGSVGATHLDGRCQASSSDGGINVTGRFDALDINSDNGGVRARVESGSTMTSPWHIRTADGSINIAVPTDFKTNIDASTSDGHITVDLPVLMQGNVSKSHLRGALNGGGESMLIRTADGSIHLSGT